MSAPRTTAVITGGSSGIGFAFAVELARRGHHVTLVARDRERLVRAAESLDAPGGVALMSADLASVDERDRLVDRVGAAGRIPGMLVNSAGFGIYRPFHASPRDHELRQIQLLVEAVADLEARWLPDMLRRRRGGIVNIASVAAFQPLPGNGTYAAAKAWVLAHTEALCEELRGTGVAATAVCPGPVATDFQRRCGVLMGDRLPSPFWCEPDDVARAGLRALERGRASVIPGGGIARSTAINRRLPRVVTKPFVRWLLAGELARSVPTHTDHQESSDGHDHPAAGHRRHHL